MQTFVFLSAHDHVLCERCLEHQGSTATIAARRDREHIKLWEAVFATVTEAHSARVTEFRQKAREQEETIAALRGQVLDLQGAIKAGFDQRPVASVQAWMDSIQVADAEDKRDASYRSRDYAMRHIWALDRLHHRDERREDQCSCGRAVSKCHELAVLDDIADNLYRWEQRQLERLRADQPHGLPDEHPEVLRTGRRNWRIS